MSPPNHHPHRPTGHCRAQRQALEYYSTSAPTMVVPEAVLSEAQENDWAACYNEVERWHTPGLESTQQGAKDSVEKKDAKPIKVFNGSNNVEGAKLWCLKVEKDGVCTGCGGTRVAARG